MNKTPSNSADVSSTLSSISVDDKITWQDKVFVSFDIDWAHDDVLSDTIDLVEKADIAATWFVTHDTPLLSRLRANGKFELGIHPNFNFLMQGDFRNGKSATEIVQRLMKIVPEAKSVRSHSTTQSAYLYDIFKAQGLLFECNQFIPVQSGITLRPWNLWNGLTRVPYFWEDDVVCMYEHSADIKSALGYSGIRVFDFHPIHVFLNTENLERYEKTRPLHHISRDLMGHRYEGYGARSQLLELMLQLGGE